MIQTQVDDRDDRIQYSDGWGKPQGSPAELDQTTTSTTSKGANFKFTFHGASVSVFGTLAKTTRPLGVSVLPNTSYTVDDGDPVFFFGKPADDIQYRRPFFFSGNLTNSTHTIVGTCVDDGGQVYIDYLLVEAPDDPSIDISKAQSNAGPPSSESSESISSSPVSTTSQPAAVSSEASNLISSPNLTPHIATITGSIAGGFTLVFIALALFLWYCRRKRIEYMRSIRRRSFSTSSSDSHISSESSSKSDRNSLVSLPSDIIIYREGRRSLQSQPVSLSASSWNGNKLC